MKLASRLQTLLATACALAATLPMLLVLLLTLRAEPFERRLWLHLALMGLGVAVSIGLGRLLAGLVHQPLAALLEATARLARGEYEARVPASRGIVPVELQQVIDGVNHLADRLTETHSAMLDARLHLEERVAQRTQELGQRNVDLGYSRATLYAVMDSMNDGLVLIAPDRRIRYVNRNTEVLLHLDRTFDPGRPADDLYAAVAEACADPTAVRQDLERAAGTMLQTLPAGGRGPRYLRWRTFPIRNNTGANLGLGHILTDVTQEHEIDRVKSELISTVSHELRTPLTAIRASASSLLRTGVEWDAETRSDFLQTIADESRQLQELIENLLDMSKIEAGVLRLDRHPADVSQLVESAAGRARPVHPDWVLATDVAPGLPVVSLDRWRLEQVLLNLIDNAVKYGAVGRRVELGARQVGDELWLTVQDEGIGIPPEHLDLVFQRFHRVDSKLTRDTGGSGLGLAICRGIVEAHGGRIWVESEMGKGSTFYVAIPAAAEEEPV